MPTAPFVSLRRFAALAVLITSSLLLAAPCRAAAAPTPAPLAGGSTLFARVQTLFHARKFTAAIALLDPYLAAHPRDARAFVLRGDCKADLGQNDAALADYDAAISIEPEYQHAYVTRCEPRLELDDKAGATPHPRTA